MCFITFSSILHRYLASMLLIATIFVIILDRNQVLGAELNSFIPRLNCYGNEQANCNEEFIDAHPNVSKSATGLRDAETWFLLFTRKNPEIPEKLHKCAGKLPAKSNFNSSNRLIVIITPFFVGICDIALYREWMAQFLIREDANILVIDYTWGNRIDRQTANRNINIVAKQTVIVLGNIQKETKIKKEQIYLVGLSLGAQVSGLVGHSFPVGRITGIDPSGSGYNLDISLEDRLDRTDADFVDVWHTNAGQCMPYFGIGYDAGDVDFWINDGLNQPSCRPYAFISLIKGDFIFSIGNILSQTLCSHTQGAEYYKVSINPGNCQFVGVKCDSYTNFKLGQCNSCGKTNNNCLIMGFDTDKYVNVTEAHQKYYVRTSLKCPYCDNSHLRLQGYKETYNSSLQTSRGSSRKLFS